MADVPTVVQVVSLLNVFLQADEERAVSPKDSDQEDQVDNDRQVCIRLRPNHMYTFLLFNLITILEESGRDKQQAVLCRPHQVRTGERRQQRRSIRGQRALGECRMADPNGKALLHHGTVAERSAS